jgi:hypothetical protein
MSTPTEDFGDFDSSDKWRDSSRDYWRDRAHEAERAIVRVRASLDVWDAGGYHALARRIREILKDVPETERHD